MSTMGLPKDITSRDVPALQAADFWVWEWRKHQLKIDGWHDAHGKPDDWDARWVHMQRWINQQFAKTVMLRKSARALLERAPFLGLIWDEKSLCMLQLRGGVWA